MNQHLHIKLFASPQISYQGQPLNGFVSSKVRALLIYLAVTAQPHRRNHLADLLWGETPDTARANLKKALSNLRQLLGQGLVENGNELVALDPAQTWVDVGEFKRLCQENREQEAIALYQGDFLTGFELPACEKFEQWVREEQVTLKELVIAVLRSLTFHYAHHQQIAQAIKTVRHLLQLEPWHEEGHRWLLMLLAKDGQRGAVQAQFERCQKIIAEEFGAEPSTKTIALYNALNSAVEESEFVYLWQKVFPPTKATPTANTSFIAGPPISQPHHFFGREEELTRIFGWWRTEPLAHVTLIGPRRSGKTSLLRHLQAIVTSPPAALRVKQKQDWLPNPQRYRWVWVDFQDPRMRQRERLLRHLLTGFGLAAPMPCSLETFMDVACAQLWREPVIVLMDELGAGLAAPELDQPFWWALRALTQATDGQLAFAIAAHDSPMRLAEDQGKTSPFFNIFTTLAVGPFTQAEALALVMSSPRPFAAQEIEWMLTQSGCWPFLLQICCQERLAGLQRNDPGDQWQAAALRRMEPFRYLHPEVV